MATNKNKEELNKELLELLKNTRIKEELDFLDKTYQELEDREELFCDALCIHCKKGCGSCCEHFIPDITSLEADYLAYGLIINGRDEEVLKQLENYDNTKPYCPLYNFDSDYHCTIYEYRPLICRLFGASAYKNKEGRPTFRNCKYNDDKKIITTEMLELNQKFLVYMQEYGIKINEFDEQSGKTILLPEALQFAIYKIKFLIDLCNEEAK